MSRPSWDQVWMDTAFVVARRSLCIRAQVGAVLVDPDNVVRAASYNGPPAGFEHHGAQCSVWCPRGRGESLEPGYDDCPAAHAEANAIARAGRTAAGGTIYVTSAVCYSCAKLIPGAGITRIVHVVRPEEAHRHPARTEDFLRKMDVRVVRWEL